MNVYIWLDDERPMPAPPFGCGMIIHAHNYWETLYPLVRNYCDGNEIYIDFDHDLGEKKTGYDVAKYIVENKLHIRYCVHSMNTVGCANIEQLLDHYGYERF